MLSRSFSLLSRRYIPIIIIAFFLLITYSAYTTLIKTGTSRWDYRQLILDSGGYGDAKKDNLGLDSIPSYRITKPPNAPMCEERYGKTYLETIRDTATGLCTAESGSNITCWHTHTLENVMILDDENDDPVVDLWNMFAGRSLVRLKNPPQDMEIENLLLPLAGSSDPMWQGDWAPHPCESSELLRAFRHRVLEFTDVGAGPPHRGNLVLTYIDRKESRRLINHQIYFEEFEAKFPHVSIRMVEFTGMSFADQLRVVRDTDILVGVHGAGLTHGMFLPEGSVMVEFVPKDMMRFKGFRNLANLAGHTYLSVNTEPRPVSNTTKATLDWHLQDVYVEKAKFLNVMDVAAKTLYKKGYRDFHVE